MGEPDGGTQGSRSALLYKALALVLAGCFVAYLLTMAMPGPSPRDARPGSADAAPADRAPEVGELASSSATTMQNRALTARLAQRQQDPNDLSNFVLPGQPAPEMAEVIDRLHQAGIHTGLGAFSPPGTSPPLVGLAVSPDYVLPEGYVRHGQATDDGQRIEAILMFSPDFEFFDSTGRPIEIPKNRVVPPHLAPPGLPLRSIEIPAPLEPGSPPV